MLKFAPQTAWLLLVFLPVSALAAAPEIPRLDWQLRSDWINVKTDVTPAAIGDGRADDTTALQTALDCGSVGKTIYLPPGIYRITKTLIFHGPGMGSAIIGAGRDTRLVWDGPQGGRMFWSDGIAYSRYVGLIWDGRGRATVGFDHAATKHFETEVEHDDEAFLNFTGYGIRVGHDQKIASAEILYHNCLFENCGTGLGLLTFNDYDNTLEDCEFLNCGYGVQVYEGNVYARDCHFENSRAADFDLVAEHGCSIRRCTSVGAKCFVLDKNFLAPLTIEDCRVASWTDPAGAVQLNGPALMFDCVFSRAPSDRPPVRMISATPRLLLSNNQPGLIDEFVQNAAPDQIYLIPRGKISPSVTAVNEHFLQETRDVSGRVFDARRDFGAKGDGKTDDTTAIQSAIAAARHFGHGAVAYLPTGRYLVSRTLFVTGQDYIVSGSGFRCGLIWRGKPDQPIIKVSGVIDVTLADLVVGHHDFGEMDNRDDILVTSPGNAPCRLFLDGVYVFGAYDMKPDLHGIHFAGLPAGSLVLASRVEGNLRLTDCASADLLFRTSYEGTVTIEGTNAMRDGLTGFLTRLTTESRPALRVFDNQSVVMSDFYVENSDQIGLFCGATGQPDGAVTIQQPKVHLRTNNPILDIRNYAGRIYYGQSLFYCNPVATQFRSSGDRPLQLLLAGDFWYKNHPKFELGPSVKLTLFGNNVVTDTSPTLESLKALSASLDDLRRLGRLDYQALSIN